MRKSTLFISVVLTAFLIATSFGAVSAYQRITQTKQATVTEQPSAEPVNAVLIPSTTPIAEQAVVVSADQAALAASNFLGRTDVYSVEVTDYQGTPAFLVTFSSGDLVYVSSDGTVLANTQLAPVVISSSGNSNNSNVHDANDDNPGRNGHDGENENEHEQEQEEHHSGEDD